MWQAAGCRALATRCCRRRVEEVASPYYEWRMKGLAVEVASIKVCSLTGAGWF